MNRLFCIFIVACGLSSFISSAARAAEVLSGTYNTGASDTESSNGETLDITFHPCAEAPDRFCGTVTALHEPNGPSGDGLLPNGEPVVGFQMIENLKPVGEGRFMRGRINAMDESFEKGEMIWYGLRVKHNADGTLTARGCLAFICPREMVWTETEQN